MHLIIGKIDMGQKITIRINGKKYELSAKTPDDEEIYRNAAKLVESTLSKYSNRISRKGHVGASYVCGPERVYREAVSEKDGGESGK